MIKVLHIGLSSNPGGVENLIVNYHRNMDNTKVRFDYIDLYGEGLAFSTQIKELDGKIYALPNYKKHPFTAKKNLKKILDENKFDIMHVHMQSAANLLPIIVGLKNKKIKIICHSHSSATPKGILRKILNNINICYLRRCNCIQKWACGEKAGYWMWGKEFDTENIIANAIDIEKYKKNESIRNEIRNRLSIEKNDKVIGFVGRFGDEKNVFFLIDILRELVNIDGHYKLLTVGGKGLYNQFISKIKLEKMENWYRTAGIQEETSDWYQAMDAFVLPSFFEGFPMVGVEAQAACLPCFMSDRISKEVDITRTVRFLPIEKKYACVWAKVIHDTLTRDSFNKEFPKQYTIEHAANDLRDKYQQLLDKE